MKKIGIFIPVFNSTEYICQVLEYELPFLKKHQIDVILCDSSTENSIQQMAQEYQARGFENLFLQTFDSSLHSNVKVFRIFQAVSASDYEYIWVIHDHTRFSEEAFIYIVSVLEGNGDFYVLNMQSTNNAVRDFHDMDQFLLQTAWRLNTWGVSILRTSTFLTGVNWPYYEEKFLNTERLNYSHIGFYFERAAELNDFHPYLVELNRSYFFDVKRYSTITWNFDTVRMCLDCWGSVISSLPDSYHTKLETMRSQDHWFLSRYSLIVLKEKNFYNLEIFDRYEKWIKLIYPQDYVVDYLIAKYPLDRVKKVFNRYLYRIRERATEENRNLYIFGAGRHAFECASYLAEMGIAFDGFLVSDLKGNPENLMDHPVYKAIEELPGKKSAVIIGVLSSGQAEVREYLNEISEQPETDILVEKFD